MTILDVIIGMSAVFLVLSLLVSSINEFIAGIFKFRSKHLMDSLDNMLGLAKRVELYNHPLIDSLTPPGKFPSYISSDTFATVLTDIYGVSQAARQDATAIQAAVDRIDSTNPLKPALSALWNSAAGDYTKFKLNVARWFDSAMDRYSGVYKIRIRLIAVAVAAVVTIAGNISAVNVFEKLWKDPTVRAAIAGAAAATTSASVTPSTAASPPSASDIAARAQAVNQVLGSVSLSIGWPCHDPANNVCQPGDFRVWFGWLLTIVAASLGAPFWFDVLNTLANVRSSGPKPEKAAPEKT